MLPQINKLEIKLVAIWILIILVIVFLPGIYGRFSIPADKDYVYLAMADSDDSNSYLSWIKQAQEGDLLFKDKFTSEPTQNLIFHPVFLVIGLISKIFKIPIFFIWFTIMLLANVFLLVTVYIFIAKYLIYFWHRILAFILITTSSGFSWFLNFHSADYYLSEISIFRVINRPFIVAFALGLMLWFFMLAIDSLTEYGSLKKAAWAGLCGLAVALIHPYDIVTVFIVLGVYIVIKTPIIKNIKKLLIIFIPALFPIVYDLIIERSDWVIGQHNKITIGLELNFFVVICGFGFVFGAALIGIIYILRKKIRKYDFIIIWAVLGFVIIYLPFNFQWRLILGTQIPLVILAIYILGQVYKIIFKEPAIKFDFNSTKKIIFAFVLILILFFSGLSNVVIYLYYFNEIRAKKFPYYLDKGVLSAIDWLDKNTDDDEIIFTSNKIGSFIPGRSGNIVYLGHWAQTIDYFRKINKTKQLFNGDFSTADVEYFFEDNNISYIFYSNYEKEFGTGLDLSQYQKVFEQDSAQIYKIN